MCQLTAYEAISEMLELSALWQEVSFSFISYSETKQETEDIVEVRRGRLRPRSPDTDFLNGELLEPYTDLFNPYAGFKG